MGSWTCLFAGIAELRGKKLEVEGESVYLEGHLPASEHEQHW